MNRRQFFRSIAAVTAAAVVAPKVLAEQPHFEYRTHWATIPVTGMKVFRLGEDRLVFLKARQIGITYYPLLTVHRSLIR